MMTKKEAAKVLKDYNAWRRYTGPIGVGPQMPDHYDVGIAIDIAIKALEEDENQDG